MKILEIKEAGSSNVLRWAMSKNADLYNDPQLQAVINSSLYYIITVDGVNMMELLKLSSLYRERLRVLAIDRAEIPSDEALAEIFKGEAVANDDSGESIALNEAAKYCIQTFYDLTMQMFGDESIISPAVSQLYIPMITRLARIQIPISFIDLVSMLKPDEAADLFRPENYLNTLPTLVNEGTHFSNVLSMKIMQATAFRKHDERYDYFINKVKFAGLKKVDSDKIYKFKIIGCYKYDPVTRSDVRVDLFNTNEDELTKKLKLLSAIRSPLMVEFAVQLPIMHMQDIEHMYSFDELGISYEDSISSIIEGGLSLDNFTTPEIIQDENAEEKKIEFENLISAYKTRLTEANQVLLNTLAIMLNSDTDTNPTAIYSLIPGIYNMKAVFTLDMSKADIYNGNFKTGISEMFEEMVEMARGAFKNQL